MKGAGIMAKLLEHDMKRLKEAAEVIAEIIRENTAIGFVDEGEGEEEAAANPIMTAIGAAFWNGSRVKVRFAGTIEEHECTGYVDHISQSSTAGNQDDPVISFRSETGTGATMCLSAIKELLVYADPPIPAKAERWEYDAENGVVYGVGDKLLRALFSMSYGTDREMRLAAKAPQLRDALRMVAEKYEDCREKYPFADSLHLMFSAHHYKTITDALEKAGG